MVTILDLVQESGITPRRVSAHKGGEYHSPCPGCGGTDRFHIWPAQHDGQGSWWCRQCNAGGDVIEYMRRYQGSNYQDAAARAGKETRAAERPVLQTPRISSPTPSTPSPKIEPEVSQRPSNDTWQEKARTLVAWAHLQLKQNPDQLEYLAGRGLTIKSIERFNLGYIPEDIYRPRQSWGLPPALRSDGKPKTIWIPQGLVIPHMDGERVLRLRIRRNDPALRYYVVPGGDIDPMPLLAFPSSWPGLHKALVVVESELDAMIIAQEAGDRVGVLALGSADARPRHRLAHAMVSSAAWIGVSLDWDAAGHKATAWWLHTYPDARDIRIPDIKDPGELFKSGESLRGWIINVLPNAFKISMPRRSRNRAAGDVPDAVREFANILIAHPHLQVEIGPQDYQVVNVAGGGKALPKEGPEFPQISRLLDLFWDSADVYNYLKAHGAATINAKNILQT